jgi:DNA primase
VGILVEDCASACSVSGYYTGIALLGTNLVSSYLDTIKRFEKVIVALDKDATSVALGIVKQLKPHVDVGMVLLEKDVKDMTEDERKRTFSKYIP